MIADKKFTLFLCVAIVASATVVINGSYHSRQKFIQFQELLKKNQYYEVEWGQLLIEKSTLASFLGLENVAKDQLMMSFPTRKQIIIVEASKQ